MANFCIDQLSRPFQDALREYQPYACVMNSRNYLDIYERSNQDIYVVFFLTLPKG